MIWDNGSTDGTQNYLESINDPHIHEIVLSPENKGQTFVTNHVWSQSSSFLVGKVDNDCMVTPGWIQKLKKAHEDIPKLGVVGCWHFFEKDFDFERAKNKIQTFGQHRIFRHPWIDGSALMMKRSTYLKYGPISEQEYLSGFWRRLALAGYINGFYYPLILQNHLDDPLNPKCLIKSTKTFNDYREITQGLKVGRYNGPEGRIAWRNEILRNILDDPYNPHYYAGWRRILRKLKNRIAKCLPISWKNC
jgi:glycosyltransferase involved in cell wall biosynthesis